MDITTIEEFGISGFKNVTLSLDENREEDPFCVDYEYFEDEEDTSVMETQFCDCFKTEKEAREFIETLK